ncbi:MAG: bifunctional diaminohydroxyphosphoribosylaminopyrimidine deaminase/5-amino-6-(5-phosphoribosylamino)uracil reductase RibD, partial [Verrucomicrobiae bacterium]|nr:bifunctional diaminohydroxyphosphoribosylaminopyrimidine deaminase/5-amino-6-(5-phosphoribosylamino)uracil reductase RibD [Verrucomicrobiae bacterium]
MNQDETWMQAALDEARKGWGTTHPNPMVGAVIVEDEEIVSRGFHARAGEPHAEVEALKLLGRRPSENATMYVTLEPCCTTGKTGPCTEAILKNSISKVVVGAIDPDERHQGRGIEILKKAGLEVSTGILGEECEDLNLIFNHFVRTGEPFLAGKTATTLDGKTATRTGHSQWITGETAREDVARWRRYFPAIAVGGGTAMADNPALTSRLEGEVTCGTRFVFDRRLITRSGLESLQVFNDAFKEKTILVTHRDVHVLDDYRNHGIQVWALEGDVEGFWESFKRRCLEASIPGVYFEGGSGLLSDLLASGNLHYLFAYRAPKFLADAQAPSFVEWQTVERMDAAYRLQKVRHKTFGDDQLI